MSSIVVGRRRSDPPDSALRFASAEAQLRGRPLTLTHVWDLPVEVSVDLDGDLVSGVAGTARAVPGAVASALMAQDAELLVLGRRAAPAQHLSRVLRSCLHDATCPVVIVPAGEPRQLERIVVGVCESEASAVALRWAAAEAALHQAVLVVVHAWQVHPHGWRDLARPVQATARQLRPAEHRLRQWVRDILPGADPVTLALHGGPLDALLAASDDADLLVIGHPTHSPLSRAVHGHIADDLNVLSPCAVAVIPGPTRTTAPQPPVSHR